MKLVIVGFGIFLLTFSALAGKFVETFEKGKLESWQELIMLDLDIGQVSWEILDSELHGIVHGEITYLLTRGDEAWRDYVTRFDVKPLEKHGPGNIAIAARIKGTWVVVCMIGDTPRIAKGGDVPLPKVETRATCIGGNFHDPKKWAYFKTNPSPLLKLKEWSTLKLITQGNIITFWINGKQAMEPMIMEPQAGFPDFLTGGIGLGLTNYTARFDNLVITGGNISDKGGLSVTQKEKLAVMWGRLKRF